MASMETKVVVLALLVLGVGFVYTNILEKQQLTGATISSPIVSAPEPYLEDGEDGHSNYELSQAPSEGYTAEGYTEEQKTFLNTMGANNVNPLEACKRLEDTPFKSLKERCATTFSDYQASS